MFRLESGKMKSGSYNEKRKAMIENGRRAAIFNYSSAPAIITSREMIIARYDGMLDQSERAHLNNYLSNYIRYIGYYMAAWGYEFYLRVLKRSSLVRDTFSTRR